MTDNHPGFIVTTGTGDRLSWEASIDEARRRHKNTLGLYILPLRWYRFFESAYDVSRARDEAERKALRDKLRWAVRNAHMHLWGDIK